jgi:rod shape-determining protein MreD
MRNLLILFCTLGLAIFLQTAMVSRITLLGGTADLVLLIVTAWGLQERARFTWILAAAAGLWMGAISGAPWPLYLGIYLVVAGMARFLTRRVWQAPLLAMFAVTFIADILLLSSMYLYRILFENTSLLFAESFLQIILPSVLINLILSVGILPLIRNLAARLYPAEAAS